MKKLREAGFYYIDKTGLIQQLLQNWGEVNLFTRSRRFGKTLNMCMLKLVRIVHFLMDCIYHRTKNCMRNIWENIRLNLTYDEIDNSIDNLC